MPAAGRRDPYGSSPHQHPSNTAARRGVQAGGPTSGAARCSPHSNDENDVVAAAGTTHDNHDTGSCSTPTSCHSPRRLRQGRRSVRRQVTTEYGEGILSNIRLSRWYLAHCCVLACVSFALIITLLLWNPQDPPASWIVVLDGIVVLSLILEFTVDVTLLGKRYWLHPWNLFDLAVVVLSLCGFIILVLEAAQVIRALDDVPGIAIVAIRYATQSVRVIRYLIAARSAQQSQRAVNGAGIVGFPCGRQMTGGDPAELDTLQPFLIRGVSSRGSR